MEAFLAGVCMYILALLAINCYVLYKQKQSIHFHKEQEQFYRGLWQRAEDSNTELQAGLQKINNGFQEIIAWYRVALAQNTELQLRLHKEEGKQRKLRKAYQAQCKRSYKRRQHQDYKDPRQEGARIQRSLYVHRNDFPEKMLLPYKGWWKRRLVLLKKLNQQQKGV